MAAELKLINKDFCWATRDKFYFSRHCGVSSIRDSRIFGCCSCQKKKTLNCMNNVGRVFGWVKMLSNVEQTWKLVAFERTLNDILCYGSAVIWSVSIKLEFFCSILFRDRVVIRFMAANRSTVPPFIANFHYERLILLTYKRQRSGLTGDKH